ncbi:MAG: FeoC-like transcriptional regulator [Halobacteriota archaeon]
MGEVLVKMSSGGTLDELSRELGMRKSTLRAMIDMMIQMEYLEEVRCGSGCGSCAMKCDMEISTEMYVLTEKGEEIIKKWHNG